MTTEDEYRAALAEFGIGLEVVEFKTRDRVNLYPTRSKGVHKMSLDLRCHLSEIELKDMMKYSLSKADYTLWLSSKQVTLASKGGN